MLEKQKKQRRGGNCHNYAGVNDAYMLYQDAAKTVAKGGCYADTKASFMLLPKQEPQQLTKGGYLNNNELDALTLQTKNLLRKQAKKGGNLGFGIDTALNAINQASAVITGNNQSAIAQPAIAQPAVAAPAVAQPAVAAKGGCGCKKGGSVELAPFAAAVALLAARVLNDERFQNYMDKNDIFDFGPLSKSTTKKRATTPSGIKTKKTSTRKPKTV